MEAEEARREEEEADREMEGSVEPWSPPAARSAEEASEETGDETRAAAGMLRDAGPEPPPPWEAPWPEAAPEETGDESSATAGMLRDAEPEPPPPWESAAPSPAATPVETGDESGATATLPNDRGAEPAPRAAAGDWMPEDAAPSEAAAASPEPAEGVTGALGKMPVAPVPAQPTPAQAAPAQAAPEQYSPEQTMPPPAERASMGVPTDAAPSAASAPAEGPAPDSLPTEPLTESPAHSGAPENPRSAAPENPRGDAPENPQSAAAEDAHDAAPGEDPVPPTRRAQPMVIASDTLSGPIESEAADDDVEDSQPVIADSPDADIDNDRDFSPDHDFIPEAPPPETVGGEPDSADEQRERRIQPRFMRHYKIQEVIRRRQILLVQVVKEERGTKGAALTTYLSLAGRFSVLMPNSPRGGGISRKITSASDRRRLKEIIAELDMPKGMGLIVRTAGANRPKPEIKRDCEYLLRLWDDIREHTMKSVAPAVIYEEASLIKRAIRDVYSRDIDEIQVDGEEGWKAAHEFMRMLMPSHAKKVQFWRDPTQPLFAKYQVEAQLDGMLQPTVQLRSGGYLVINQAEALVAIDVNSGRATRERNVEEMALRTNLEAADEVARQLRLRDLAGLIVIDFIDMESKKHNSMVERRIKEALKNDRARIQVGHISHFGLLEMSRQRLRPSLAETSFILCPHCGGTGHVRSTESAAIHVLRGIEEEGGKRRAAEIVVHVSTPTALYILNHKRDRLREIELRYGMRVTVLGDDTQMTSQYRIDRVRPQIAREDVPAVITPDAPQPSWTPPEPEAEEPEDILVEDEPETEDTGEEDEAGTEAVDSEGPAATPEENAEQAEHRRRRRRRRRGRREDGAPPATAEAPAVVEMPDDDSPFGPEASDEESVQRRSDEESDAATDEPALAAEAVNVEGVPEHIEPAGDDDSRRRRGRRGGRRRRREGGDGESVAVAAPRAEQPDLPPVYIGPTPANPFGGEAFDIFDVLEQAEANAAAARVGPAEPVVRQFEPAPAALSGGFVPEVPGGAPDGVPDGAPGGAPEAAEPGPAQVSDARQPDLAEAVTPPAEPDVARVPDFINTAAPEPVASEPVADAPQAEPDPQAAPPTDASAAPEPEPEVANDVAPEPAIRPILVGSGGDAAAEKKRGWWRR